MAVFKKAKPVADGLFNIHRTANSTLANCRLGLSSFKILTPFHLDQTIPGEDSYGCISQRIFLRRPGVYQSSEAAGANYSLQPIQIREKLRGMNVVEDRINLNGLIPPPDEGGKELVTVGDARKLMKLSQMGKVKDRIREVEKACVTYDEFLEICSQGWWCKDQAKEVASMLDQSGNVVVFGNIVFLRPEQVVKAIQDLLPAGSKSRDELNAMEEHKAAIDKKSEALVRRELWLGLWYFVIQTAAFMRLTFWELSWDVMEPICFFVTSMYCMYGYAFFLRTSKEPSFEGFYRSRFIAKQKRLMKVQNFDIHKYNKLHKHVHHS